MHLHFPPPSSPFRCLLYCNMGYIDLTPSPSPVVRQSGKGRTSETRNCCSFSPPLPPPKKKFSPFSFTYTQNEGMPMLPIRKYSSKQSFSPLFSRQISKPQGVEKKKGLIRQSWTIFHPDSRVFFLSCTKTAAIRILMLLLLYKTQLFSWRKRKSEPTLLLPPPPPLLHDNDELGRFNNPITTLLLLLLPPPRRRRRRCCSCRRNPDSTQTSLEREGGATTAATAAPFFHSHTLRGATNTHPSIHARGGGGRGVHREGPYTCAVL